MTDFQQQPMKAGGGAVADCAALEQTYLENDDYWKDLR